VPPAPRRLVLGDQHGPGHVGPGRRLREQVGVGGTGLFDDVEAAPAESGADQFGAQRGLV
jgi:hypothetical protein